MGALRQYLDGHFLSSFDNFRWGAIYGPLMFIEVLIYILCVRPSYRRYVWQYINRKKYDEEGLGWLKGRKNRAKVEKQIEQFVRTKVYEAEIKKFKDEDATKTDGHLDGMW